MISCICSLNLTLIQRKHLYWTKALPEICSSSRRYWCTGVHFNSHLCLILNMISLPIQITYVFELIVNLIFQYKIKNKLRHRVMLATIKKQWYRCIIAILTLLRKYAFCIIFSNSLDLFLSSTNFVLHLGFQLFLFERH